LIADAYAKNGEWLVYLPDFFEGDPVQLKVADVLIPVDVSKQSTFAKYTGMLACAPSFLLWLTRHREAPTNKVCMDFLGALRKATATSRKIGMVGFCWGGKYALRAGLKSNMIEVAGELLPLVDAVSVLHPSNLAIPADVDDFVVPVSFGWGKEDVGVNIQQKSDIEQLHAKLAQDGRKIPEMQHKVYTPGRHGFAVRGNPDDPQEKACLVESEAQVMEWMKKWL